MKVLSSKEEKWIATKEDDMGGIPKVDLLDKKQARFVTPQEAHKKNAVNDIFIQNLNEKKNAPA